MLPGGKLFSMFRAYPNLYADLSAGSAFTALTRDFSKLAGGARDATVEQRGLEGAQRRHHPQERTSAAAFLLEFQDRLLFGRDTLDDRMQTLLNSLDLPAEARHKIFCANAEALLAQDA